MLMLVFGICLVGYSVSTPAIEDTRIVGGEDVDITEVPYQVSLMFRGRHTCGGAIISNDLVITAAHCLVGSLPSNLQIRAGSSSSRTGGEIYQVGDYVYHSNFTYSRMDCDIGVLWLSQPIEFNERVAPIDLYEQDEEIEDGDETIVTGWGNLREGGGSPQTLQIVSVPTVSEGMCSRAYSPLYRITKSMLCAGVPEGGKDACQGDSGGPLVHDGKLAGIVSWGLGCARPNYPGVYAKVSHLRDWIDDQVTYLRLKHIFRIF
ncbi:vitellin-degrading protease-like [Colias croceus]|uniref:vitellin-degrading protease-like n=1 Tax=Colias crocea TaxID=72248 RepID=UPI001E28123C|nr:vitellin-degrading protease-like [Colias croceus]